MFDKYTPHIKFSVTDFATKTRGLRRKIADNLIRIKFFSISIKASIFVHTSFAGSGPTKIAVNFFLITYIFLARIAIIWPNFSSNFLRDKKYFILGIKIHCEFCVNFYFIFDIFFVIFLDYFLQLVVDAGVIFGEGHLSVGGLATQAVLRIFV